CLLHRVRDTSPAVTLWGTHPSGHRFKGARLRTRQQEERLMGWIIALIVGGVAGWLASMVMNRDASMGIFWNIIVGIIGSLIGNLLAGPLFGINTTVQRFSIEGLLVAVVGAIVLLGIVNLVQRG